MTRSPSTVETRPTRFTRLATGRLVPMLGGVWGAAAYFLLLHARPTTWMTMAPAVLSVAVPLVVVLGLGLRAGVAIDKRLDSRESELVLQIAWAVCGMALPFGLVCVVLLFLQSDLALQYATIAVFAFPVLYLALFALAMAGFGIGRWMRRSQLPRAVDRASE